MTVVLLSESESLSANLRQHLASNGQECSVDQVFSLGENPSRWLPHGPELVVVVLSPDIDRAIRSVAEVRAATRAHILAVGPISDSRLILSALRRGADDYLAEEELESELHEVLQRLESERNPGRSARIISFLASSGGSGSTTLAVNLAMAFAVEHHKPLLVDLKLETGDCASLLDLRPRYSLADLCQSVTTLDRSILERSLVCHENGVALLASPRRQASALARLSSPGDDVRVTEEGIRKVLQIAQSMFPYIIADISPTFREEQMMFLRQSDMVLLVLRLDFHSLRNTRRTLEHLDLLGVNRERIRIVANRHGQPKEVPAEKAEQALETKIFHYVPDDPSTINRANNYGLPAVLCAPRTKVSASIRKLALALSPNGHG